MEGGAWTTLHLLKPFLLPPHAATVANWESALHLTPGSWSVAEPGKIMVPAGFEWIELKAGICFQPELSGWRQMFSRRNGLEERTEGHLSGYHPGGWANASSVSFTAESAIMSAVPGDYFELLMFHDADRALWVGGVPTADQGADGMVAYGCVYFEARFY
jgi:hypothetical protein